MRSVNVDMDIFGEDYLNIPYQFLKDSDTKESWIRVNGIVCFNDYEAKEFINYEVAQSLRQMREFLKNKLGYMPPNIFNINEF